jgi:hypothetical protein
MKSLLAALFLFVSSLFGSHHTVTVRIRSAVPWHATGIDTANVKTLCLTDGPSDQNPICLSTAQLVAVLAGTGGSTSGSNQPPSAPQSGSGATSTLPEPVTQNGATSTFGIPPTMTINGDNPAVIHVGDTYTDLGATAVDHAGTSLSLRDFLNSVATSEIAIDTTISATDTIHYVATDTWGNTARDTYCCHRARPPTAMDFSISGIDKASASSGCAGGLRRRCRIAAIRTASGTRCLRW